MIEIVNNKHIEHTWQQAKWNDEKNTEILVIFFGNNLYKRNTYIGVGIRQQ